MDIKELKERERGRGVRPKAPEFKDEDEAVMNSKTQSDLQKIILAATANQGTDKRFWETDTGKAVIIKVTSDDVMDMTSNLTPTQVFALKRLLFWYSITGNERIAVYYISHIKLSKSITQRPISLLEGLFRMSDSIPMEISGRMARAKQMVMGR